VQKAVSRKNYQTNQLVGEFSIETDFMAVGKLARFA